MKITHPILTRHILTAPTVESLESRIVPSGIGDLFVSISDAPTTSAEPGDTLTYDIDYGYVFINSSFPTLSGVKLTVNLDPNLSFVPSDNAGSNWVLVSNTLTKNIGALDNLDSGSASLKLRVKDFISANGYYSGVNTTVVISDDEAHGMDSYTQNNQANDSDTLTGLTVEPTITGITDPVFAQEGHQATFTVLYNNLGNTDVFSSGTSITVTLPDGVSFNEVESDSRWNDNENGTITAYDITIPAGNTEDLGISYVVDVSYFNGERSPLETRAQISSSEQIPANSGNNDEIEFTPIYTGFIVTAPGVAIDGKYAKPVIRVFDKSTGEALYSFSAYEPKYRDSIRVALGDFNGDGVDDIVTTTMHNGGRMRFFDGTTGERFSEGPLSAEVAVFGHAKNAGAFVAVGKISGNNLIQPFEDNISRDYPEIVVGSSLGGGKVKVYSLDFQEEVQVDSIVPFGGSNQQLRIIKEYTPFGAKFKGGVRVAVGDVDSFGQSKEIQPAGLFIGTEDDIIVGQGFFGNKVKVYKGATNEELMTFTVGGAKFRGGVSVAAGYVNGDSYADIIVGRNSGKPSVVEVYDGRSGLDGGTIEQIGSTITPFDIDPLRPKNTFGVRVAAGDVNGDGVADIITSVGVKKGSKVKIYDGMSLSMGQVSLIEDRAITAYSQFPNVALWIAASKQVFFNFNP
jgi:hypothetical protein